MSQDLRRAAQAALDDEMPPLPPAYSHIYPLDDDCKHDACSTPSTQGANRTHQPVFTADQTRAFARLAVEQDRARRGEQSGPAYGILDPDYARVFTMARVLAWSEGYAITMHGSFTRDLDLLAVPWTDTACDADHLVRRIADAAGLRDIGRPPSDKPHGRRAWTLRFLQFGDPRFIDLSVMPRVGPQPAAPVVDAVRRLLDAIYRDSTADCESLADEAGALAALVGYDGSAALLAAVGSGGSGS